jgi:hypothetical protein
VFLTRDLSHLHTLRDLNAAFIEWLELTYHNRVHTTLGMKPIDRFGLDLDRIRYLAGNPYSTELFMLEDTRKVRIDNTFSFNARRYEAPRDMRGKTITIRYHRHTGFPPPSMRTASASATPPSSTPSPTTAAPTSSSKLITNN